MKKLIKKIGKFFIALNQKDENSVRKKVLLVDGGFILPNNFVLIIKGVKEKFRNRKLVILTFQDKEEFLKDNFPDVEIIVPDSKIKIKKYRLAIQLFFLLRRNFNFVVLSSLDISLLSVSLIFSRCPIFLHNRWMEWYRIRYRTLSDVLRRVKSADRNRRKRNRGIKDILKTMGRAFVILSALNEEDIKSHILIEDNGYTDIGHILTATRRAQELFINADITILTFAQRKQHFINMPAHMKLTVVEECNNRYKLAIQMYRMRKNRFDYIILTALDISPIIISFLFFRANILLYNRWHQWWSLGLRNIWEYFKYLLILLLMIPVCVYLLFAVAFILFKTGFRLKMGNLKSVLLNKKNENGY